MMNEYSFNKERRFSAFPIAKEGFPFIFISAFATMIFALIGVKFLAVIGLCAVFFVCFFFRDPDRLIPNKENAVVSPADGKVVFVDVVDSNPYIDGTCVKISVFMSVFNVHINRVPFDGLVKKITYFPGKFFNASLDKASKDNERNAVNIETKSGIEYCVVQIAGLIARRIICKIQENEELKRGERFGLICFGSRLDIYLPHDAETTVKVGDKVEAGNSILAYFNNISG